MNLQKRFQEFLISSGCVPERSRVLVAVSGGADSIALLSLLCKAMDRLSLHLEVAHLDHSLRVDSCEDARFVAGLCAKLGVHPTIERRDVAEIARQFKGGLEEVSRNVRRDFLMSTARTRGCHLIALGHHADDQSETFLLRLLRGSRLTGLAGMRVVNSMFVRPLLPFSRKELRAYLKAEGLAWCEDKSNLDQGFARNRIRHQLLPNLEEFNPKISRHLASLCEQLQQDDDYWAGLVARELPLCGRCQGDDYLLDRLRLLKSPPALRSRLVRAALEVVRGDLRGVTAAHTESVLTLVTAGPPQGELCLPGAWVGRRYDTLWLRREAPEAVESFSIVLDSLGSYALPDGQILRVSLEPEPLGESLDAVEYASDSLSLPLQVRHSQPGDRLRPSGMDGSKKIQDLFVDLKLTKEARQKALLLLKEGEVLWVAGVRRSGGREARAGGPVLRIVVGPQIGS